MCSGLRKQCVVDHRKYAEILKLQILSCNKLAVKQKRVGVFIKVFVFICLLIILQYLLLISCFKEGHESLGIITFFKNLLHFLSTYKIILFFMTVPTLVKTTTGIFLKQNLQNYYLTLKQTYPVDD